MELECSGFSQIFSERTRACPRVRKGRLDSQSWAFKKNFFAFLRGIVGKSRQTPRVGMVHPGSRASAQTDRCCASLGSKRVALAALRCGWCPPAYLSGREGQERLYLSAPLLPGLSSSPRSVRSRPILPSCHLERGPHVWFGWLLLLLVPGSPTESPSHAILMPLNLYFSLLSS